MYIPPSMQEHDPQKIREIVTSFPFATVVSWQPALHITHVPLMTDGGTGRLKHLLGHVARANPHAQALAARPAAVAVFQGPHGYVSPTWYHNPGLVPTWNYVAVHVHGRLEPIDDPAEAEALIVRQVAMFERDLPDASPSGREMLARKLPGVAAFRLEVERVEAKLKLGQNREVADRIAARQVLERATRESDRELAAWMKATEPADD